MATTFVFADDPAGARRRPTSCRGCGRAIEFATNAKTGRVMPFDAPIMALTTKHDANGKLLEEVDLATSHFATCPKADTFRKAR
jgi:hypothetical protein